MVYNCYEIYFDIRCFTLTTSIGDRKEVISMIIKIIERINSFEISSYICNYCVIHNLNS